MGYAWTEPYALHTTIPLNRPEPRLLASSQSGLSLAPPLLVARRYYEWVFPPLLEHGPLCAFP